MIFHSLSLVFAIATTNIPTLYARLVWVYASRYLKLSIIDLYWMSLTVSMASALNGAWYPSSFGYGIYFPLTRVITISATALSIISIFDTPIFHLWRTVSIIPIIFLILPTFSSLTFSSPRQWISTWQFCSMPFLVSCRLRYHLSLLLVRIRFRRFMALVCVLMHRVSSYNLAIPL